MKSTENETASNNSTVVLRVPKPNLQVVILGLIALTTLFQTVQLLRISSKAGSVTVKTPPAAAPAEGGSGTDVPQSMVGGC